MTHQIIRTPHGVPSVRGFYIQDPAGYQIGTFPSEQEAVRKLAEVLR